MFSKKYSSEGVILARKSKGEADRLITVITKNFGRKQFIAKGVRKTTSRKRGHIEIFSHVKFSAVQGDGIDYLTEVELINSFDIIRNDLRRVSVAYFFSEVVIKVTHEEARAEHLFDLLLSYLHKLEISTSLKTLRKEFSSDLLISTGFWPKDKPLHDPDKILEEVIERKLFSSRVGKKVLS